MLDLLNSSPTADDRQSDHLLGEAGSAWRLEHGGDGSPGELEALVAARTLLSEVIRGGVAVRALSPLLSGARSIPSLGDEGVEWAVQVEDPAHRLAVRAVLAWDAVTRSRPGRLRACGNPGCARFLLDRTKAGIARWCSMAVCGNRMKARRHRERSTTAD